MKLNKEQVVFYKENGYLVVDDVFSADQIECFNNALENIIRQVVRRAYNDTKDSSLLGIDNFIDTAIPILRKVDARYPAIIQRTVNRIPEFLRLGSDLEVAEIVKALNQYDEEKLLYLISHSIVFSDPNNIDDDSPSNFVLDWHNDVFSTIPYSKYTHIWAPLIHDSDEKIGTLKICPKSHKQLIKQHFDKDASYNHRFRVDEKDLEPYEAISVEMTLGQALFFDRYMIHRSGINQSNKMRYSMIGLFHDTGDSNFFPIASSYRYMKHTPYQQFYELYHDESARRLIDQELEPDDELRRSSV